MHKQNKRVLIVSGEASGDMYAARLITEMLDLDPHLYFFGMGADNMRAVGADILVDAKDLAVVGIVEVLSKFNVIYSALKKIRTILKKTPPDLVILIDYPGFNLRVAKMAKQAGVKVLYYISPQIWAWRKNRIHTLKKYVDWMTVILPFEAKIYEQAQIPVTFVGHPIVEQVSSFILPDPAIRRGDSKEERGGSKEEQDDNKEERHERKKERGDKSKNKTICLMPGSRSGEIKHLLPVILESAALLKKSYPSLQLLLPLAPTVLLSEITPYLKNHPGLNIEIIQKQTYTAIQSSDAVITASGTATLEIALLGVPMVIIYKLAPLSYFILKKLAKINYIGLCNIIAEKSIVPELIQDDANPEKIVREIKRFLEDNEHRADTERNLAEMKMKLGEGGASKKVAELAMGLLSTDNATFRTT